MLLGRGPAAFLRDATSLLGALLLATSEERPDAGGRGSESEGAGGAEGGGRRGRGGRMSATNKMQQRVSESLGWAVLVGGQNRQGCLFQHPCSKTKGNS
jgi:hypothetical protein